MRPREDSVVEADIETIYEIIGNQNKRAIVEYLGEHGRTSFTTLKNTLNFSVGNLYYNLDALEGIVTQDEDRMYLLTEEGQKLCMVLKEEMQRFNEEFRSRTSVIRIYRSYLKPVFTPSSLFLQLYQSPERCIVWIVISLLIGVPGSILARLDLTVLDYDRIYSTTRVISVMGFLVSEPLWIAFKIVASWALITASLDLLSRLFGAGRTRVEFIVSTLVAMIPIFFYPFISYGTQVSGALGNPFVLMVSAIVFRVLQVVTIGFLTTVLNVFKNLRLERSFVIVFFLFNISYTLGLLT